MPEISLSNSKGRDAQVMAESVRVPVRIRWLDTENCQVSSTRILKGTIDRDFEALSEKFGTPDRLAAALVAGDPEIDPESVGSLLQDTSRVYVNADRQVVYAVAEMEIVRDTHGAEKLRRPKKVSMPNVAAEKPLLWSGKLLPKREVFNKFVMVSKLQIVHVNGLTFDFLYEIARELEQKESLLVVGAGPKATQPLILRRGAVAYRGFLDGKTRGAEYCLVLHLSNIELKAPERTATVEAQPS